MVAGKYLSYVMFCLQVGMYIKCWMVRWVVREQYVSAFCMMKYSTVTLGLLLAGTSQAKQYGFLKDNGNGSWIIGNDVWNMTQERIFGSKLYYKDQELVGEATGHYVSYSELLSSWALMPSD